MYMDGVRCYIEQAICTVQLPDRCGCAFQAAPHGRCSYIMQQYMVLVWQELLLADTHGLLGNTPLGSGTFGTVERTCTGQLGPVVCKWAVNVDDEASRALDVEADNLASFRHPAVVTYYGRVLDPILRPSQTGIVMECMDSTLATLLNSG